MRLSTHFTLEEFTASDTAARLGIDNDLPAELYPAAKATAEMLEVIRAHLSSACAPRSIPVVIASGYRCPALNTAIGSSDTSDHRKAMAADIKVPDFGDPLKVALELAPMVSMLGIGQLILEFYSPTGGWVHVSTRVPDKLINRIITINKSGTRVGIVE